MSDEPKPRTRIFLLTSAAESLEKSGMFPTTCLGWVLLLTILSLARVAVAYLRELP